MKKLVCLFVASAFMFQACEGPAGPPGPAGADGLIGEVFEEQITFTANNNYAADFNFNIPLPDTDKLIGFIRDGEDNQGNDNWEPLPQTLFYNGGTFIFTYNFSRTGFTVFIDGNENLSNIPVAKRTNQIFRFVIIPAAMAAKLNTADYNAVMAALKIDDTQINSEILQLN